MGHAGDDRRSDAARDGATWAAGRCGPLRSASVDEPTFRVSELTDAVQLALDVCFPDEVWVQGEISSLKRSAAGHVYFQLDRAGRGRARRRSPRSPSPSSPRPRPTVNATLKRRRRRPHDRRRRDPHPGPARPLRAAGSAPAADVGHRPRVHARAAGRRPRAPAPGAAGRGPARPATACCPLAPRPRASSGWPPAPAARPRPTSCTSWPSAVWPGRSSPSTAGCRAPTPSARSSPACARWPPIRVDVIALVRGGGARTDLATFDSALIARTIAAHGRAGDHRHRPRDRLAASPTRWPTPPARRPRRAPRTSWPGPASFHDRVDQVWVEIAGAGRAAAPTPSPAGWPPRVRATARAAHAAVVTADRIVAEAGRRLALSAGRATEHAPLRLDSVDARVGALDPRRALERGWSITRTGRWHAGAHARPTSAPAPSWSRSSPTARCAAGSPPRAPLRRPRPRRPMRTGARTPQRTPVMSDADAAGPAEAPVSQRARLRRGHGRARSHPARARGGDVDLDRLAGQVRRAADLVRLCRGRLDDARTEVTRIVADLDAEPDARGRDSTGAATATDARERSTRRCRPRSASSPTRSRPGCAEVLDAEIERWAAVDPDLVASARGARPSSCWAAASACGRRSATGPSSAPAAIRPPARRSTPAPRSSCCTPSP